LQNSFWTNLFISLFDGRITSFFGEKIDCSKEEAMAVLLSRDALHVNDFLLYNIDAFENWNNPISISSDRNEDITWRRIVILTISKGTGRLSCLDLMANTGPEFTPYLFRHLHLSYACGGVFRG
jgi:hypothetical protein